MATPKSERQARNWWNVVQKELPIWRTTIRYCECHSIVLGIRFSFSLLLEIIENAGNLKEQIQERSVGQ